MYPGTLVPDVSHFEEIFIETYFPDGVLEKRFMSSRGAGGNHNPVQGMLLNDLLHFLLSVLSTGIEVLIHVYHVGKGPGILLYPGDIYHSANVNTAVANENSHPGLFARRISFGG
jgi:hypothetical protein